MFDKLNYFSIDSKKNPSKTAKLYVTMKKLLFFHKFIFTIDRLH